MRLLSAALAGAFLSVLLLRGAIGATETVVYSFCGQYQNFQCLDGDLPDASLIDINGTLYGTTLYGGTQGYGTVFSLDPATGAETAIYSFCSQTNCTDGYWPPAHPINVRGTLYGTTNEGGAYANCTCGTVFSLNPATGAEAVLHSFGNGTDGTHPDASVLNIKGTLYGTTVAGGEGVCYGGFTCGTIFSLDPATGAETVLYSFCTTEACPNGAYPHAALISIKGKLYGTTESGGVYNNGGTVFVFDPATGKETVLHSFGNGTDGNGPFGGRLIDVEGMLYGTTVGGGAHGGGIVFSVDPKTGAEKVIYSFCRKTNCADGDGPFGGVVDVNGMLFGTTENGGAYGGQFNGYGTVYSIDPKSAAEKVLHSFASGSDGYYPEAGLINVKGVLYGTTYGGGAHGEGTVFAVTP